MEYQYLTATHLRGSNKKCYNRTLAGIAEIEHFSWEVREVKVHSP